MTAKTEIALETVNGWAVLPPVLKIDAEGFEPDIIAGCKTLLSCGRIALIIWEWGDAFVDRRRQAAAEMIAFLSDCGFRHYQPPGQQTDGPLTELDVETAY